MKKGDFIHRSDLIQKGFYLHCWFAGFIVYKGFDQDSGNNIYVFLDYWKNQIESILISKQ
jgi:hypothetical protein